MENKKLFEDGSLKQKYRELKESLLQRSREIGEMAKSGSFEKELKLQTFTPMKVATFEKLISRNSVSMRDFITHFERSIFEMRFEVGQRDFYYALRSEFSDMFEFRVVNDHSSHAFSEVKNQNFRTFSLVPNVDQFRRHADFILSPYWKNLMEGKPACENWKPDPWVRQDVESSRSWDQPASFQSYLIYKAWTYSGNIFLQRRASVIQTTAYTYSFEEFRRDAISIAVKRVYSIAEAMGVPVAEVSEVLASDLAMPLVETAIENRVHWIIDVVFGEFQKMVNEFRRIEKIHYKEFEEIMDL